MAGHGNVKSNGVPGIRKTITAYLCKPKQDDGDHMGGLAATGDNAQAVSLMATLVTLVDHDKHDKHGKHGKHHEHEQEQVKFVTNGMTLLTVETHINGMMSEVRTDLSSQIGEIGNDTDLDADVDLEAAVGTDGTEWAECDSEAKQGQASVESPMMWSTVVSRGAAHVAKANCVR